MNKTHLPKLILDALGEKLGVLEKAARASHAEATDEGNKAENKYDTRALEAAYLAGGQARQANDLREAIKVYQALQVREFAPGQVIDLTALVEIESGGARSLYFIGPCNGGLEIEFEGREVTVLTPQSPLGQTLLGKKAGARWTVKAGSQMKHQIFSVR